jgi:adenosylcobyric acid synthase
MHIGRTTGPGLDRALLDLNGRPDGAVSDDGRVLGSYLHGLFASDAFRHAFLARLKDRAASGLAYEAEVEATLDKLAAHLERCLDLDALLEAARHAG